MDTTSNYFWQFQGTQAKNGPKTLILDLDETLVHSWENPQFLESYQIYNDPTVYRKFHPIGSPQICYSMFLDINKKLTRIWGLNRPYLYEFLSFASGYFENIIVWSAGAHPYVNEITRYIFLESGLKPPKMIWSRTNCSSYQGYFHKPILSLTTELSTRSYQTFTINPKDTLILDDKPFTFMENPQSGLLCPVFHPGKDRSNKIPTMEDLTDRSDRALLQLKEWLERPEVRNCLDVRTLDKTSIFK